MNLVKHVERAIDAALQGDSKLSDEALALEGFSSATVRHFLNNLCRVPSTNYFEVGTFKGSTLIAASFRNPGRFTAVDNFSEFPTGARDEFQSVRRRFKADCRFAFFDANCWSPSLPRRLPKNVNVYFYDGSHSYQDHHRAFVHYHPVFANRFVAVVDDWNWPAVRQGTRDALAALGYSTLFEREFRTKSPFRDLWWNGLFIAVLSKTAPHKQDRKTSTARGSVRT